GQAASRTRKGHPARHKDGVRIDVPRSRWIAAAGGLVLVAITTAALLPFRGDVNRAGPALVLVLPGIAAGLLGGRVAAIMTALVAALALNLAFIPPFGTPKVDAPDDVVAFVVFVAVALVVGALVANASEGRRSAEARAAELLELHERLQTAMAERERLSNEAA